MTSRHPTSHSITLRDCAIARSNLVSLFLFLVSLHPLLCPSFFHWQPDINQTMARAYSNCQDTCIAMRSARRSMILRCCEGRYRMCQICVVQDDRKAGSYEVISVHNAMQSISALTIGLVNEQPLEFAINLGINHTSRLLLECCVRNGNYRWNDTALRTISTVAWQSLS